jgi:DNA repair exonuclease SbcCD nuclease subunit
MPKGDVGGKESAMPYETMKFVHAARLLVGRPLAGTGPLAPESRALARRATTQAFQNLVRVCIEQDVDFVLLTGDTFDAADANIPACVALRRGFEKLQDAGIQVFVVPGPRDGDEAWASFPELPGNVTIFHPEKDDPVAVLRDGSAIASIRAIGWRQTWFDWDDSSAKPRSLDGPSRHSAQNAEHTYLDDVGDEDTLDHKADLHADNSTEPARSSDHRREARRVHSSAELRPNHFAIAILRDGVDQLSDDPQADYVALVGAADRTTTKGVDWLLHSPGGTQALSPDEPGLRGCSVVELDSEGVIRCRFVPTSSVRFENLELTIADDTTFEELVEVAHATCRERFGVLTHSHTGRLVAEYGDADDGNADDPASAAATIDLQAEACCLRWTIRGGGPLWESLQTESLQRELMDWIDSDSIWPREAHCWHLFRMLAAAPPTTSQEPTADDETLDVPREFAWRIDQAEALGPASWSDLDCERLETLADTGVMCDPAIVFSRARQRGRQGLQEVQT